MNERIRELAELATSRTETVDDYNLQTVIHTTFSKKKFAELIVTECVTKLKETKKVELPFIQAVNEHAQELPLSVYIAELKQHFGVEE
jgi:hypothetical protein